MEKIRLYELSSEDCNSISTVVCAVLMTAVYSDSGRYNILLTLQDDHVNVDVDVEGIASDCHFSISPKGNNRACDMGCYDVLQNLKNNVSECGEDLYCISAVALLKALEESIPKRICVQVSNIQLYER